MLRIFFKYRNMCVTEKTSKERIRFERNPVETLVSELQYRKQRYASVLYISRRRRAHRLPRNVFFGSIRDSSRLSSFFVLLRSILLIVPRRGAKGKFPKQTERRLWNYPPPPYTRVLIRNGKRFRIRVSDVFFPSRLIFFKNTCTLWKSNLSQRPFCVHSFTFCAPSV